MNFGYKRRTRYSYIEKNKRKCPVNEKLGLKILKMWKNNEGEE
jgi:hypothetical protein